MVTGGNIAAAPLCRNPRKRRELRGMSALRLPEEPPGSPASVRLALRGRARRRGHVAFCQGL